MKIRLADYIANTLVEHGIEQCFMVTGGGAMHLNDAFGHHKDIHCTFHHHEQACAIAAEGYARIKGKAALVNVTTGPGGTNALTGVMGAYLDSIPMIIISGQVRYDTTSRLNNYKNSSFPLRSYGDQEFDITKACSSMCKYAVMLEDYKDIKYILKKALNLVNSGRPGPVWIDIPLNYQSMIIDTDELKDYEQADYIKPDIKQETIDSVIEKIKSASRPVLYPGTGVRLAHAYDLFKKVINKLNIPVVTYWDAIDLIETDHPLYVGRAGNMGDRAGNFAVQNSDLLIVLGNRLSIRNTGYNYKAWARKSYVIMIDIDEGEMLKDNLHVEMKVHGDAKDFLEKLDNSIQDKLFNNQEWLDKCQYWKNNYPVVLDKHYSDTQANPYAIFDYLSKQLKDNNITVTANGTCCVAGHQSWVIKKDSRFLNNNGSATMGYGLPASIGACIANNNKQVICLEGDGSIMMNLQELQTIVTNKLPIKILMINNAGYHSIRQTQDKIFAARKKIGIGPESNDLSFPDFEKIIKAFNIPYYSCKTNEEFLDKVNDFLNEELYSFMEVFVSTTQLFEPKNDAKILEDGTLYSPPLEDLSPFLSKEELEANMYIPLWEEE